MDRQRIFFDVVNQLVPETGFDATYRHFKLWSKTCDQGMSEAELYDSGREYVGRVLPQQHQVHIEEVIPGNSFDKAKWLKELNIPVADTIMGHFVDQVYVVDIQETLSVMHPVWPWFQEKCIACHIEPSRADLQQFSKSHREFLCTYKHHPIHAERLYADVFSVEMEVAFQQWSVRKLASRPVVEKGYCSLAAFANSCGLSIHDAAEWLDGHTNKVKVVGGQLLIDSAFCHSVEQNLREAVPLTRIFSQLYELVSDSSPQMIKESIDEWLKHSQPEWLLKPEDLPISKKVPCFLEKETSNVVSDLIDAVEDYPGKHYSVLSKFTGLSLQKLEKQIQDHVIAASQKDNDYYVSIKEIRRIRVFCDEYTLLDEVVEAVVHEAKNPCVDLCKKACRDSLAAFMDDREYFGCDVVPAQQAPMYGGKFEKLIRKSDIAEFKQRIWLAIRCLGQSHQETCINIMQAFEQDFPETVANLRGFLEEDDRIQESSAVNMLDMLLAALKEKGRELSDWSETDLIEQAKSFVANTKHSGQLFAEFVVFGGYTRKSFLGIGTISRQDVSAYSWKEFAVIVASIVCMDVWRERDLVTKALDNPLFAELWAFVAIHVFAIWRVSDIVRIEAPLLRYSPEEVERKLRDGTYTADDARMVVLSFQTLHNCRARVPQKTSNSSGIAPLYFSCPASSEEPLGIILSIATIHYMRASEGKAGSQNRNPGFIKKRTELQYIREFFGPEMVKACRYSKFSGRRANKAMLQAIEFEAKNGSHGSPCWGYFLASILRSHKGGYGKLAETTAIYLEDGKFSGYTPEFVAFQMFERGVCSFFVDILMTALYGTDYKDLSVEDQTHVIKEVGLSPLQLSELLEVVNSARDEAETTMREVMLHGGSNDTEMMEKMLGTIVSGHALGKDCESVCLCTAAGIGCLQPSRLNCLACKFEVVTKASLLEYMIKFQRLKDTVVQLEEYVSVEQKDLHDYRVAEFELKKASAMAEVYATGIRQAVAYLKTHAQPRELGLYAELKESVKRFASGNR